MVRVTRKWKYRILNSSRVESCKGKMWGRETLGNNNVINSALNRDYKVKYFLLHDSKAAACFTFYKNIYQVTHFFNWIFRLYTFRLLIQVSNVSHNKNLA